MNPTKIAYNGEEHTTEEWSTIFGIDKDVLIYNLRHNDFSLEAALKVSGKKRERLITYQGKTQNLRAWSEELGIPYFCLRSRLNTMKWTVEKAFSTPYGGTQNGI